MREIITDAEQLSYRVDEVDVRKQNKLVQSTVIQLKDIIREKNLTGLSAPAIGENIRLFVINFNGNLRSFINPIMTDIKGFELSRETCECIPGKTFIRPRHNQVTVTYQTPLGKIESRKLLGQAAIVFQHQLDHLDGLLLSDIGLEIGEDFDNATDEEKQGVISMYLDSLDIKRKEVEKEIAEDKDLKQMSDAIDFITGVQTGEVKIEGRESDVTNQEDNKDDNNKLESDLNYVSKLTSKKNSKKSKHTK